MQEVLTLEDIINAIKKHIVLIIVITVLLTGGMIAYTKYTTVSQYTASTKLFIGKDQNSEEAYNASDVTFYKNLLSTYTQLIETKELIRQAIKDSKYEDINERAILSSLSVESIQDTQIISLSYTSTDSKKSAEILNIITNEFIKESSELIKNSNVKVIEPVEEPKYADANNNKMKIIIAFCTGVVLSLLIIYLLEYFDNTYDDKEKFEKEIKLPVLATIPYAKIKEDK